jgi:phage terminase large subunit-like protein
MLAMNQVYYWAFNNSGSKIAWVSPIYKQCKKVFDEMVLAFADVNLINSNASELIIKLPNGSTIQFFSAERYDNIRGFTFDYLVCDEFAFMAEQAWSEVLRATVLVKGKKVLLISTPKGKNHFYNLFNLDGTNHQYKSFKMSSYDGLASKEEIDGARYTLPENVFKQEYLAEFVDNGSGVFRDILINNQPAGSGRYYAGIDLGRADDYTVITVLNERGQMVECQRYRHNTWDNICNNLLSVLNKWKPKAFIEVNSIGDVIFEQLKNKYRDVEPFTTTSKTKNDAIEALQVAIQNKEFSSLDIDWLRKEFDLFTYEYNHKTRSIKYSAPNGFHDDGVVSCAIAYQAFKNLKHSGKYSMI